MARFEDLNTETIEFFIREYASEDYQVDGTVYRAIEMDEEDEMLGFHECEVLRSYYISKSELEEFIEEEIDDEQEEFYVVQAEYFTMTRTKRHELESVEERINRCYEEIVYICYSESEAIEFMDDYYQETVEEYMKRYRKKTTI